MKSKNYIIAITFILCDILALIESFYLSYFIRANLIPLFLHKYKYFFPISDFYKFSSLILVYLFIFFYENLYFKRYVFWEEFIYIVRGLLFSTILIVLFVYFSRSETKFARTLIILMFFSGSIIIPFFRYLIKYLLNKTSLYKKNSIFIGNGKNISQVIKKINEIWYLGYNIIGIITDKKNRNNEKFYLGNLRKLKEVVKKYNISTIIIQEEGLKKQKINQLINLCEELVLDIKFIPDALILKMIGVQSEYLIDTFLLSIPNNLAIPANRFLKRVFDIILSFVFSLLLLPFFIFISILIKLDSKGPAFFIQERIGYNGELFKFLKFRSMYIDGDKRLKEYLKKDKKAQKEWKKYQKLKSYDPRITRIGKFLRRFSIDEMPQIFNVLIGNMSIVGPRPYLPREKKIIGKYASIIFKVKPGLTGLWQVRGRNKLTFSTRLKLDEFYVRNWSFTIDFMILAKTVKVVLTGEGAY